MTAVPSKSSKPHPRWLQRIMYHRSLKPRIVISDDSQIFDCQKSPWGFLLNGLIFLHGDFFLQKSISQRIIWIWLYRFISNGLSVASAQSWNRPKKVRFGKCIFPVFWIFTKTANFQRAINPKLLTQLSNWNMLWIADNQRVNLTYSGFKRINWFGHSKTAKMMDFSGGSK